MKYTQKIDSKVTSDTVASIQAIAEKEDRSFSGTIRTLLNEAIAVRKLNKTVADINDLNDSLNSIAGKI